jgi:hypothetical protein
MNIRGICLFVLLCFVIHFCKEFKDTSWVVLGLGVVGALVIWNGEVFLKRVVPDSIQKRGEGILKKKTPPKNNNDAGRRG